MNTDRTNIPGGVNCTCIDGWSGPGIVDDVCVQDLVDECTDELHDCDPLADCVDLEVGYNCFCSVGLEGTGFVLDYNAGCTDIDECANTDTNNCDAENGFCVNKPGKFRCRCNDGFSEVSDDGSVCLCNNSHGSYECACLDGFTSDDNGRTCVDIDECADPAACDDGATCTNTIGAFSCSCGTEFTGTGTDDDPCVDIDKCDDSAALLGDKCDSSHGQCVNTAGSFECQCNEGYEI